MKFTVVKKIYPNCQKSTKKTVVKMGGGNYPAFSINIAESLLRRAKIVIGDRVTLAYGKDDRGDKWLLIESDPNGYKILSTKNSKGGKVRHDGEYSRGLFKTTNIEDFMVDEFSTAVHYDDSEAEVDTGYIALPFGKKKGLFR